VMIEFRQSYVGPLMRKYGNMFRAGDCPNDSLTNRLRTLDIRLICGNTAAHSDMLMWHASDPVESAALQIINILFSVPQISVLLDKLPPEHLEMTRFWLGFWVANRDVLLDGELAPLHPEALYPVVTATIPRKRLIAFYGDAVADAGKRVPPELILVNGTLGDRIVIELPEDIGRREFEVRDCRGRVVNRSVATLSAGVHAISIPPSGVARLSG
jgi:alpha-galactosidase